MKLLVSKVQEVFEHNFEHFRLLFGWKGHVEVLASYFSNFGTGVKEAAVPKGEYFAQMGT